MRTAKKAVSAITQDSSTPTPATTSTANKKILTLSDLDSIRKSPSNVTLCYIEKLGGYVYSREVNAKIMRDFLDFAERQDEISKTVVIDRLAEFASTVLCNEDGSDFISFNDALKLSLDTLDSIASGVSEGLKAPRDKSKRGNASRR